jgi:hypothetical protein
VGIPILYLSLRAGLAAQAFADPGRPGVLRLYPGLPVVPGELVDVLEPDLVVATWLYLAFFGQALVFFGYPVQLFLRFAGERPA